MPKKTKCSREYTISSICVHFYTMIEENKLNSKTYNHQNEIKQAITICFALSVL